VANIVKNPIYREVNRERNHKEKGDRPAIDKTEMYTASMTRCLSVLAHKARKAHGDEVVA
jgi:hypothetical protein